MVTAFHLRQAGQARLHAKTPGLPRVVPLDLIREGWPWPDDAHLTANDID